MTLVDFILHVDRCLMAFGQGHGNWVHALLFLIIFGATGLLVMPWLPGDSPLFGVGALAGAGLMNCPLVHPGHDHHPRLDRAVRRMEGAAGGRGLIE